ncbi:hypothetical protein [Parasphingorhabdus sp.]|uniref:hypothetical protein n=1 Tax=Parasphingorhabdus sp. TaxID=2709688 RepID=UPI002B26D2A5|nr:hypothetical protein [Parasphingorhabdus sp.]
MTSKIERLGPWAEKSFSTLCSEFGVIANKSEEDETGWDFLLEFPQATIIDLPPDLQKIELSARAQIKSRERGKLVARLKLSNAHRFAASPEPCFVILAAATDGGHPVQYYAKHFWKDEIERTLKRLRQADQKNKPTNMQSLNISFDETDNHTQDLIPWIRRMITNRNTDYARQKQELNRNLGYEDGRIFGTFTFRGSDIGKLVDHSIGLNAEIEMSKVRMVDRRFGIEAKKPILDLKPDRVEMRAHPQRCKVEIIDTDDYTHQFDGEIFTPGIPNLPPEEFKARVVAGPLEALLRGTGETTINYHFNSSEKHELKDLIAYIKLLAGFSAGPVQFSITLDGKRMDSGPVTVECVEHADLFSDALVLLQAMLLVVLKSGTPKVMMSLDDILKGWEAILEFRNNVEADTTDFSIEGDDPRILETKIDRLVTGLFLTTENYRITAVLAYKLINDSIENQTRKLTFKKPTIVYAIVDEREESAHGNLVEKEIKRYAERHGQGVISIHQSDQGAAMVVSIVNPTPIPTK